MRAQAQVFEKQPRVVDADAPHADGKRIVVAGTRGGRRNRRRRAGAGQNRGRRAGRRRSRRGLRLHQQLHGIQAAVRVDQQLAVGIIDAQLGHLEIVRAQRQHHILRLHFLPAQEQRAVLFVQAQAGDPDATGVAQPGLGTGLHPALCGNAAARELELHVSRQHRLQRREVQLRDLERGIDAGVGRADPSGRVELPAILQLEARLESQRLLRVRIDIHEPDDDLLQAHADRRLRVFQVDAGYAQIDCPGTRRLRIHRHLGKLEGHVFRAKAHSVPRVFEIGRQAAQLDRCDPRVPGRGGRCRGARRPRSGICPCIDRHQVKQVQATFRVDAQLCERTVDIDTLNHHRAQGQIDLGAGNPGFVHAQGCGAAACGGRHIANRRAKAADLHAQVLTCLPGVQ